MTQLNILKEQIKYNTNKSTQRVYNTFEKGQTLPSPLFLAQLSFLLNRKKERILPGLIAACYELKSNAPSSLQFLTPSPLNTF